MYHTRTMVAVIIFNHYCFKLKQNSEPIGVRLRFPGNIVPSRHGDVGCCAPMKDMG